MRAAPSWSCMPNPRPQNHIGRTRQEGCRCAGRQGLEQLAGRVAVLTGAASGIGPRLVMPGVRIGDGAVIAAGAVATANTGTPS